MADEWQFWRDALAGKSPETTPGTPHAGYFVRKKYVSLPFGAKRVLCDQPVAIWREDNDWHALIGDTLKDVALSRVDEIEDQFAACCMNAITFNRYLAMVKEISEWRTGQ